MEESGGVDLGMDAARGYSGAYLIWRERRNGEERLAGVAFVSMRIWTADINTVPSAFLCLHFLFTFSTGDCSKGFD